MKRVALALCAVLALGGCRAAFEEAAPPRLTGTAPAPATASTLRLPLAVPLGQVQGALEARIPRLLWQIDEPREDCIPAAQVRPFGRDIRLTPAISCRVTGEVRRARLRVEGDGQDLLIRLPVTTRLSARDIGGLIDGEGTTGTAEATLRARLSVSPDWRLGARVNLTYEWDREPGITFLGMNVNIAARADAEMAGLVQAVERELEREFSRIDLAPFVASAWARGFTVMPLGSGDPPAYLHITPQQLGVAGFRFTEHQMLVDFAMAARTRTQIGTAPRPPAPAPLPPQAGALAPQGLQLVLPVLAEYGALEPLLLAELQRRAATTPGIARFDRAQLYATTGNRLAIGITGSLGGAPPRTLWLTGMPHNEPGSTQIALTDLQLALQGHTRPDDPLAQLLLSDEMRSAMERALVADVAAQRSRAVAALRGALASVPIGSARFAGEIAGIRHGTLRATAPGLYLPLEITGSGRIDLAPPAPSSTATGARR